MAGVWSEDALAGVKYNTDYVKYGESRPVYNLDESYLYISHLDEGLRY